VWRLGPKEQGLAADTDTVGNGRAPGQFCISGRLQCVQRPSRPLVSAMIAVAWPPSIQAGIGSVMQGQGPNDHRGQRQHDRNIYQLPATASPVPSMPEVVVNGSNFVG
jgi:hypothetical protein